MRFSSVLKSSPHCLLSPDGTLIAALWPSSIGIRSVESLDTIRTVKLPADLARGVTTFVWSPSSKKLLLSAADQVHVLSAAESQYHATIRNPSSSIGKSAFVDFGATDDEALVCSAFGIKLSIFNLSSSQVVEISNPKFYQASSAARGFSFRPCTHHLALLTRTSGKDTVSIHSPDTREVQRSWNPDLIDAQGLSWTPNGKWLVVWESAAYGHKILFYTADGHIFTEWCGPSSHAPEDMDHRIGAGVKLTTFSQSGHHFAIADSGRCIYLLNTSSMTEHSQLRHPPIVEPRDTLQIWQEQSSVFQIDVSAPLFFRACQPVSPPGRPTSTSQESSTGCEHAVFDSSSALLATKLEESPTTVWIWDLAASELRAVLMFHASVSGIDWHPTHPELLLVKCEGQAYNGVVFVWDPLSDGPQLIDLKCQFPDGKMSGRGLACWLKSDMDAATLFFADSRACILGSFADSTDDLPWKDTRPAKAESANQDRLAESSLDLVSVSDEESDGDASDLDDTFRFKRMG